MPQRPNEILESALLQARERTHDDVFAALPEHIAAALQTILEHAESQKAVLGVTLTSIVYKIHDPQQDIRRHQESMAGGYSGRTFDTKYITPFLQREFPHFAMAESAWLTRSLEQPHPYDHEYPGKIRSRQLKAAFLSILHALEETPALAEVLLVALLRGLLDETQKAAALQSQSLLHTTPEVSIAQIVEAVRQHIWHDYEQGQSGTARLPVLAIYSVYALLVHELKRYDGKILAPLEAHTSPDARSHALGDIDIRHPDGLVFESVEIKHGKPITPEMVKTVYRKIQKTSVERYYLLTTREPETEDPDAVSREIETMRNLHPCQVVVNGVLPSLKYYLRLVNSPAKMIVLYTQTLEAEYRRGGAIKRLHLETWQAICRDVFNLEPFS